MLARPAWRFLSLEKARFATKGIKPGQEQLPDRRPSLKEDTHRAVIPEASES
jgi:hypothetical protein